LQIDNKTYHYFSLPEAAKSLGDLDKLPMSLKVRSGARPCSAIYGTDFAFKTRAAVHKKGVH
ncbi:hypothetical protein ACQXZF_12170, partial [Corynebacterium diphtheriae]